MGNLGNKIFDFFCANYTKSLIYVSNVERQRSIAVWIKQNNKKFLLLFSLDVRNSMLKFLKFEIRVQSPFEALRVTLPTTFSLYLNLNSTLLIKYETLQPIQIILIYFIFKTWSAFYFLGTLFYKKKKKFWIQSCTNKSTIYFGKSNIYTMI